MANKESEKPDKFIASKEVTAVIDVLTTLIAGYNLDKDEFFEDQWEQYIEDAEKALGPAFPEAAVDELCVEVANGYYNVMMYHYPEIQAIMNKYGVHLLESITDTPEELFKIIQPGLTEITHLNKVQHTYDFNILSLVNALMPDREHVRYNWFINTEIAHDLDNPKMLEMMSRFLAINFPTDKLKATLIGMNATDSNAMPKYQVFYAKTSFNIDGKPITAVFMSIMEPDENHGSVSMVHYLIFHIPE